MHEKSVLLVDDEQDFCRILAEILQSRNFKVDIASSGGEALEKIKDKPDVVLLDRNLGDMDGLEVCRKIREDTVYATIPIIIVSARGMAADRSEGLHNGADDYVVKPFDSDELLARIEAVSRRHNLQDRHLQDRQKFFAELGKILEAELVRPFYQPIFDVKSRSLLGLEALTRPPADSILSNPELLFKAAIQLGKYFELETLGWRRAYEGWLKAGPPGKIFLNCNPYFIEDKKFQREQFLKTTRLNPKHAVLEITERLAIVDYTLFIQELLYLKGVGFEVAVDDVGSGYAGLRTIAELKPNMVKIDMALIRGIHTDELKQNIVRSIIDFCQRSGIRTIAEGIETKQELNHLIALGVDAVQGYFLAKPSPAIVNYRWEDL